MSFADPQSITIGATTSSLPRVSVGRYSSDYQSADGLITLRASSSLGNRTRRVIRVDHKKLAADVFQPDRQVERSMSCYLVFDLPAVGYTNAEALEVYTGFKTLITANTDGLITKLLGGES
jgi:hypothetical protein